MSDLPRKNGWTIAKHVGDATPDRTQRLLNHTVWDHDAAMRVVRGYMAEHLGDQPLVVAALDESRAGEARCGHGRGGTAVLGCADRIANGVNTVYCSYATPGGHALVGARIYLPADQFDDDDRRVAFGISDELQFRTSPSWPPTSSPT